MECSQSSQFRRLAWDSVASGAIGLIAAVDWCKTMSFHIPSSNSTCLGSAGSVGNNLSTLGRQTAKRKKRSWVFDLCRVEMVSKKCRARLWIWKSRYKIWIAGPPTTRSIIHDRGLTTYKGKVPVKKTYGR